MKLYRVQQHGFLALLVALLLGVQACGLEDATNSEASSDVSAISNALDNEFGNISTKNEDVAFGDSDLSDMSDYAQDIADPILDSDPDVAAADLEAQMAADNFDQSSTCKVRNVILGWGQKPISKEDLPVSTWGAPGRIEVSSGAIVVRKLLHFEPVTDYLLDRTDRRVVEFNSKTTIHWDGIVVSVISGCPSQLDGAEEGVEPTLSTDLGEKYSLVLNLAETDDHYEVTEKVDDLDNSVGLLISKLRPGCRVGFAHGRYAHLDKDANYGNFRGVILDFFGEVMGHIRGIYGKNNKKLKRFAAKIIDEKGEFEGVAYGYGKKTSPTTGRFKGRIANPDAGDGNIGNIRGAWKRRSDLGDEGFFVAVIKKFCHPNDDDMDDSEFISLADPVLL